MRDKLTQAFFERAHAAPGSERTIFWDRALPGFGLMVTISEHKSFVFQYRIGHASRRMKLDGKFLRYERKREEEARKRDGRKPIERRERPGKTELDAARTEATMLRAAVKDGRDPLKELRHASLAGTNTLKSVCDRYLEAERKKTGRDKLRTLDQRRAMLERLVYPRLGDRPIHDIRRSDIVRLLDSIEERAQARGRNGAVMADRTLATVRKIMN